MTRNKKLFFFLIMFLMVVVIGRRFAFSSFGVVHRLSSYAVYPLLLLQKKVVQPIAAYTKRRATMQGLEQLVVALQEKHESLLAENIQLKSTLQYGDDIKELLDFKQQYTCPDAVLAQVLLKNFSEQSHFFLVNAGANKGIQKDMVVIYKNNLIGKVVDVYPWYSKIVLVTDRTCKVAACCMATRAQGIHEGQNCGESTVLNYVNHLANMQVDDLVISSGTGPIFPRGFALGKVASYERKELLYRVNITPLIDLRSVEQCMILPKGFVSVCRTNEDDEQYAMLEQEALIAASKNTGIAQSAAIKDRQES